MNIRLKMNDRIEINNLHFSAAHFLILGESAEPLHGHNFEASLQIAGEKDNSGILLDFIELKRIFERVLAKLEHKLIVPTENEKVTLKKNGKFTEIDYANYFLRLPTKEICFLPFQNASTEFVAQYIAEVMLAEVKKTFPQAPPRLEWLEVAITEMPGAKAYFRKNF